MKQLIIIGGGATIQKGINKDLWNKLKDKWTIGLNYNFEDFNSTLLCYVDRKFYQENKIKLAKLPLVIGHLHNIDGGVLSNTIMIKAVSKYNRDVRKGCYKGSLVGVYSLSLGIYLLDEGEIFLLGYDYGEMRKKDYEKMVGSPEELKALIVKDKSGKPITHYYQGRIKHRGIGKINYYNSKDRASQDFGIFKNEKKVKIYNVSLISKIPEAIFEKISYNEFFKKLDNKKYNQNDLRLMIKEKLGC